MDDKAPLRPLRAVIGPGVVADARVHPTQPNIHSLPRPYRVNNSIVFLLALLCLRTQVGMKDTPFVDCIGMDPISNAPEYAKRSSESSFEFSRGLSLSGDFRRVGDARREVCGLSEYGRRRSLFPPLFPSSLLPPSPPLPPPPPPLPPASPTLAPPTAPLRSTCTPFPPFPLSGSEFHCCDSRFLCAPTNPPVQRAFGCRGTVDGRRFFLSFFALYDSGLP